MSSEDKKSPLGLAQMYNCMGKIHAVKTIENILKKDININCQIPANSDLTVHKPKLLGNTALHFAVAKNDIQSFKLLLDRGADFTIKNDKGFTPLHCVIEDMNKDSINFEVNPSSNDFINSTLAAHVKRENTSNPCNSDGLSHFHIACLVNNVDAVEFFLKHEVAIDHTVKSGISNGWSGLHFAAGTYSSAVVKILLSNNANRWLKNKRDMAPSDILLACRMMLLSSANISNKQNYSAEKVKSENEKIEEILRLILTHNVDINNTKVNNSCNDAICSLQNVSLCKNLDRSSVFPGSALYFAAQCNTETLKFLVSNVSIEKNADWIRPLEIIMNNYKVEDVYDMMNFASKWENIIFADKQTHLSDLILAMRDPHEFYAFLRDTLVNVNLPISNKSPFYAGCTALNFAVLITERFKVEGDVVDLTLIELCLKRGADVTLQDSRGQTPIHIAYRQNKMKTVEFLIKHHRSMVNPIDQDGLSHLHIACALKNERLVRDLIDYVDVNVVYKSHSTSVKSMHLGCLPLHVVVASQCSEIAELLLKGGADVNARDGDGLTAIHRVLFSSEAKKVGNVLLSIPNLEDRLVVDINLSHLHIACFVDNVEAVEKLLDLGADINASIVHNRKYEESALKTLLKPYLNFTPLEIAVQEKSTKTVELLLKRDADILIKKPDGTFLLIDILTRKNKDYQAQFLSKLWSDKDLQKRLETEEGVSMLHIACRTFNHEAIADLLKTDINVNLQVPMDARIWPGNTPLHVFLYKASIDHMENFEETLKLLLEKGANVTVANKRGSTPIHYYVYYGSDRSYLRLLLDYHLDFTLNPADKRRVSHFHFACFINHVEVVKQFLKTKKMPINQSVDVFFHGNGAGSTPLDLAVSARARRLYGVESQVETIDLLLKHGADPNIEDAYGMTPLHTIAKFGPSRVELFRKFVEYGVYSNHENSSGVTPFETLLKSSNVTIEEIDFFLNKNCQVNSFNSVTGEGYMSLLISKKYHNNQQSIVFERVNSHSDKCLRDDEGRTIIHNVVATTNVMITVDEYVDLIVKFTKKGVDVDEQDKSGKTSLQIAAYFGNEKATDALLKIGADVNITDVDGKSAFSYAIESHIKSSAREKVIKSLANHVYKLQFLKLEVSKLNESLLEDNKPNVDTSFFEKLNECCVVKCHTLDIEGFLSETGTVASYCSMLPSQRDKIDLFFETFYKDDDLKELVGVLRLQYRKAVERLRLHEPSIESLRELIGWLMPDVCRRVIVRRLGNSHLKELIAATEDEGDMCL